MNEKITKMYAVIATHEGGDEGIPAVLMNGNAYPLVASSEALLPRLHELAGRVKAGVDQPVSVRLVRFNGMEEVPWPNES